MTDAWKDTQRALFAANEILDGRNPITDRDAVMVTLEHLVSTVLLITMSGDHRKAAEMLSEGLAPGVEGRLAYAATKSNCSGREL